jgi:hypothetical protein
MFRVAEQITPILRTDDANAAVAWYARLGFGKDWEHRFEPGLPLFRSDIAWPHAHLLSEHRGDASRDTLVYLSVDDIDAVAAEFGQTVWQARGDPRSPCATPMGIACGSAARKAECSCQGP